MRDSTGQKVFTIGAVTVESHRVVVGIHLLGAKWDNSFGSSLDDNLNRTVRSIGLISNSHHFSGRVERNKSVSDCVLVTLLHHFNNRNLLLDEELKHASFNATTLRLVHLSLVIHFNASCVVKNNGVGDNLHEVVVDLGTLSFLLLSASPELSYSHVTSGQSVSLTGENVEKSA